MDLKVRHAKYRKMENYILWEYANVSSGKLIALLHFGLLSTAPAPMLYMLNMGPAGGGLVHYHRYSLLHYSARSQTLTLTLGAGGYTRTGTVLPIA
jgi:hypothetical protein